MYSVAVVHQCYQYDTEVVNGVKAAAVAVYSSTRVLCGVLYKLRLCVLAR
jgi:hypothetical protein